MRGGGGRAVHRTAHKVARRIGGVSAMQRLRVCPCVHANAQGGKRYSEQELASPSGVTTSRFSSWTEDLILNLNGSSFGSRNHIDT